MNLRIMAGATVGLLLFFMAGCSTEDVSLSPMPSRTPGDNPASGAVVRRTRQAEATATQQAVLSEEATQAAVRATQTTEAHAGATANAATAVAARATVQAIVLKKTDWPQIITDTFTDNQLGWPLGVKQDHSLAVTSTLEAGRYFWRVKADNGNSYFNLVPTNTPVSTDFVAAVNVQFGPEDAGTSAYGLTFRHVKDDYGFFGIKSSGEWLALEVHHTGIYQSSGDRSSLINTRLGHANRLEVIARGSDFVLRINGQPVGMLTAEIDPGQIGLGVDAARRADTTEVVFTDFEVYAPGK